MHDFVLIWRFDANLTPIILICLGIDMLDASVCFYSALSLQPCLGSENSRGVSEAIDGLV